MLMKKLLIIGCAMAFTTGAIAQTPEPEVIETFNCLQLSGNGEWMLGRSNTWYYQPDNAYYTETSLCNTKTGEIYGTGDLFSITPYSCPVSGKGIAMLSTYDEATNYYEVPYLVVAGQEPKMQAQFYTSGPYAGKESYSVAINDEATWFLGYYEEYPKQYPFICAINEDLTLGEPEYLEVPEKDIFGFAPYSLQLTSMSEDARTVAGSLLTSTDKGRIIAYPIVYKKGDDGKWTYSYPLLGLFDLSNPEDCPTFYYFQVALSPDGNLLACTQEKPGKVENFPDYVIWTVDLNSGIYSKIESENTDIVATRILDNGTVTGTFFATIRVSYIYTPGAEDFVDFVEYVSGINADYGQWMEDNLMVKVQDYDQSGNIVETLMPDTGQVFVSDDLSVIAAGFQLSEMDKYYNFVRWSYVFTDLESSGVNASAVDSQASDGSVYNIHGVKVGSVKDGKFSSELAPGLYIVNGKKILINK